MIELRGVPSGRMGNRLFNYHFLRQLAGQLEVDYGQPALPDRRYFEDMGRRRAAKRHVKRTRFDAGALRSMSAVEVVESFRRTIARGEVVELAPPFLGDFFFDYLFVDPRRYVKIKPAWGLPSADRGNDLVVGIHFRGGDFQQWDRFAVLPSSFYLDAIDKVVEWADGKSIRVLLCTDDRTLDSYSEVKGALERDFHIGWTANPEHEPMIRDFVGLTECDVLISSPSTFSVWAGCLGKEKKIVHSRKWLDYRAENGDAFWIRLAEGDTSYYRLWKAV